MNKLLRFRLSVMMFLQYAVLGAVLPVLSLYLRDYLHFTGIQTGLILAMGAVAACTSPLASAFLADRVMSAERLLALCHLIGGLLIYALSGASSFYPVLLIYLLYALMLRPTIGLTNAVVFHHVPGERSSFAGVRVWGTAGWIAVAWTFSFLWLRGADDGGTGRLPDILKLSAVLSGIMFIYSLTLPSPEKEKRKRAGLIPKEAFNLFRNYDILILALVNFLVFIVYQYYYVGASPFLAASGISEKYIMPFMTIGQLAEVIAMSFLAFIMRRISIKKILVLGLFFEVLRFSLFSIGGHTAILIAGIGCHGGSIAFFVTASLIYLDRRCSPAARSGAHQLLSIIAFGFASLLGSTLAGWSMDLFTSDGIISYQRFWMVPAGIAGAGLILLITLFRENPGEDTVSA